MGAKTTLLVYSDGNARAALSRRPRLDRDATLKLARQLFPGDALKPLDDGTLLDTYPGDDELYIGCFPGVRVVAALEFGIDNPSKLDARYLRAGGMPVVTLHAMHSVVDWFGFARWSNAALVRSLSVSPEGVVEDIGPRLPFERPYWEGQRRDEFAGDDEPAGAVPFHPLELGEAALDALFGFVLEGTRDAAPAFDPADVPLMRFARSRRPRWQFWRR